MLGISIFNKFNFEINYILLFLGVSVKWKNGAFGSCGGDNNKEEKELSYTVVYHRTSKSFSNWC